MDLDVLIDDVVIKWFNTKKMAQDDNGMKSFYMRHISPVVGTMKISEFTDEVAEGVTNQVDRHYHLENGKHPSSRTLQNVSKILKPALRGLTTSAIMIKKSKTEINPVADPRHKLETMHKIIMDEYDLEWRIIYLFAFYGRRNQRY